MTRIIAIDPGVKHCAVACLDSSKLIWVEFQTAAKAIADTDDLTVAACVIERPAYQGARTQAARPEDLIALAWSGALLAGAYAASGAELHEVTPQAWKGSLPKPVHHAKLWAVLSNEERELLGGLRTYDMIERASEKGALERWKKPGAAYYPRTWETHNLLDAVALGMWYVGRLKGPR
jgi:hypothetical protein